MSASLALLNSYRAAEGLKAITAWKKSRHQAALDAYVAADKAKKPAGQLPSAAEAMRPVNEELGQRIKGARAAWKASGATMSKKDCVVELMADGGASIHDIVTALGVTATAARSLVGDVRRIPGAVITLLDGKYFIELPTEEEGEEE